MVSVIGCYQIGCNAVSWAPSTAPNALFDQGARQQPVKRFVSGGCDNLVKIWRLEASTCLLVEGINYSSLTCKCMCVCVCVWECVCTCVRRRMRVCVGVTLLYFIFGKCSGSAVLTTPVPPLAT